MVFTHDTEEALLAAVALVNTVGPSDVMSTSEQLDAWVDEHGYTGRHDGDEAELSAVRALRPVLRALLTAERDELAGLVNASLARARALPRLVRHGVVDWHLHAVADDAPLARRIEVETAMALVDVVRADELSRLSVCADPGCEHLVVDLSRNRSRRFCSTTCANRGAVAAYRARRSSAAAHEVVTAEPGVQTPSRLTR